MLTDEKTYRNEAKTHVTEVDRQILMLALLARHILQPFVEKLLWEFLKTDKKYTVSFYLCVPYWFTLPWNPARPKNEGVKGLTFTHSNILIWPRHALLWGTKTKICHSYNFGGRNAAPSISDLLQQVPILAGWTEALLFNSIHIAIYGF